MIRHPGAEPEERFCKLRRANDGMNKHGRRMDLSHSAPLFDVDRAVCIVDGFNVSKTASRGLQLISVVDLRILRRKSVAIDGRAFCTTNPLDEFEASYRVALFEEFLIRESPESEEFPPRCLFFAAMPFQHMGQQPLNVFVACSLR